jgi:hypothetical protein
MQEVRANPPYPEPPCLNQSIDRLLNYAPIRPFLVDQPFQKMRQDGGHDRAEHQVIGLSTLALVACPRSQPKAG